MYRRLLITALLCASIVSCKTTKSHGDLTALETLQVENNRLKQALTHNKALMKHQMITSLTFQDNNAEQAMNFYVALFDNSKILSVQRWGADGPMAEGRIMKATFELDGNLFMCSDSPPIHDWDFSPAVSSYLECENEAEINRLFSKLAENGTITMALQNYGFSQKFGWVVDQFGVSWQLNLQ